MKRMFRFAVAGALALAACIPTDEAARTPRYTLVVGIDVSGSFRNSGSYDDALSFAAHYLEAHINGRGYPFNSPNHYRLGLPPRI